VLKMRNKKTKPMIAFIGIDGSGKTSLIQELSKKIQKQRNEKVEVIYMGLGKDSRLPLLQKMLEFYSKLRYKNKKAQIKKSEKGNYRERNCFWLFIQYFDLWFRYRKAKKLSKGSVVFFDRFFYEGLILGTNKAFRIFKNFTPVPNKSKC
jgi:thymidylate kinase